MAERTKASIEERVREVAEPILAGEGLELLDVEFVREQGYVLRLFIDNPAAGHKVGLDDCERASRAVDTALEVEDVIAHEYSLEVSSPGLNRPLKKPVHYERVVGKKVRVKTFGPLAGTEPPRKNFLGVLAGVEPDGVRVQVEGAGEFRIPYKDIAHANLEFEF